MAPSYEHTCVACGAHHASTRRSSTAIGRPYATCGRCGGFVPRPPFEEWAAMQRASRLRLVLGELAIAVCVGLLPVAAYAAWGLVLGPRPGRTQVLLAAAAGTLVAGLVWLAHLAGRIRDSRRRMADQLYRAELVKFELAGATRTDAAGSTS